MVGLAIGQSDFAAEQEALVGRGGGGDRGDGTLGGDDSLPSSGGGGGGDRGGGGVDILIATPGRLIDHLDLTHGFSLTHLQYLILDEVSQPTHPPTHSSSLLTHLFLYTVLLPRHRD